MKTFEQIQNRIALNDAALLKDSHKNEGWTPERAQLEEEWAILVDIGGMDEQDMMSEAGALDHLRSCYSEGDDFYDLAVEIENWLTS